MRQPPIPYLTHQTPDNGDVSNHEHNDKEDNNVDNHIEDTSSGGPPGRLARMRRRQRHHEQHGDHMRHGHIHHAPHGRGGRHRARRGAILDATLLLLDERPMHGYEIITELETRSDGRWRPSPGAIYPALGRMEEHGLVEADEIDGKKQFRLTAAGRERLTEYRSAQGDDAVEPWNDTARGPRGDLRGHVAELVGQVRQVGRFGTPEQIEQAATVLTDAKRRLYAILATEPSEAATQAETQADSEDDSQADTGG